jgi:hypothetical protein
MASIISTKTSGGGGIAVTGDTSGVLQLASNNGTTAVTIDASQNVGIGTSSPTFNSATGTVCHINNSTAGAWAINHYTNGTTGSSAADGLIVGQLGADAYIFNYENSPMIFATNSTERMRIDSSGQVGIGIAPATQLDIKIPNAGNALRISNSSGTANYNAALFYNNATTSLVGYINVSGSTTGYVSTSDYRLKEDVVPMVNALDKVSALKPVTYKWKADGSDGQGFIAHELAEVVPDCVAGEKDAVNEDGSIKPQGIDTSFLVATLTAAIQEQQAIITDLKARIEVLEAK